MSENYSNRRSVDAASDDGLTIGLIDMVITAATLLNQRIPDHWGESKLPKVVKEALTDLYRHPEVKKLVERYDEKTMDIIHRAAELLEADSK